MPLRDHFHPPLLTTRPWEGVHSAWATMIAQVLNRILPPEYVAFPQVSRDPAAETDSNSEAHDLFEVRVIDLRDGPRLAAAIELISPANKDRPAARQAFAGKCAGLLRQGVGLLIVDVVTNRHHDLHRELLALLELDAPRDDRVSETPVVPPLYAVAYRTIASESSRLEVWPRDLLIGTELPTLPLWLSPELAVPVNLETSYAAACEMLRIA